MNNPNRLSREVDISETFLQKSEILKRVDNKMKTINRVYKVVFGKWKRHQISLFLCRPKDIMDKILQRVIYRQKTHQKSI